MHHLTFFPPAVHYTVVGTDTMCAHSSFVTLDDPKLEHTKGRARSFLYLVLRGNKASVRLWIGNLKTITSTIGRCGMVIMSSVVARICESTNMSVPIRLVS